MQGSPRFQLNAHDAQDLWRLLAISGISAAAVTVLQGLQAVDFGVWNPAAAVLLTVAIKAIHQWASDNTKG